MAIQIAYNVMALDVHNGDRADAPPKENPAPAKKPAPVKKAVNAVSTATNLTPVEAMLCAKFNLKPEDFLENKDRARRGLNAMSGTVLGGDGKAERGPIGGGGFRER